MNSYAEPKWENSVRAAASTRLRKGAESSSLSRFAASRPEAVAQKKIHETLNRSPEVASQLRLQQSLNRSPRVTTQAKLAASLSDRRGHAQSAQPVIQRQAVTEEEATGIQPAVAAIQCAATPDEVRRERDKPRSGKFAPLQRKENNTGLPVNLKTGVENLSGIAMDDVRVHYNSAKPARLQALAYTQGTNIHVAPGQERHLAHEAWHVVQQKQGRVRPTTQGKDATLNDDSSLEREADVMGTKAVQSGNNEMPTPVREPGALAARLPGVLQRKVGFEFETGWTAERNGALLNKTDKIGHGNPPGYKVESDDDGRMEFIIDPPLEISSYLIGDLDSIFDDIAAYIAKLIRARDQHRTKKPEEEAVEFQEGEEFLLEDEEEEEVEEEVEEEEKGSSPIEEVEVDNSPSPEEEEEEAAFLYAKIRLSEATGNSKDAEFIITPADDGKVRANPQITAGMTLSQVAELPRYLTEKPLGSEMRTETIKAHPGAFVPRMNGETYKKVNLNLDALGGDVGTDLKGLVALAASYIHGGNVSIVPYQKVITDGFLLSRTDFAHLFYLLPEHERRYFVKNPGVWVDLVLTVAGVRGSSASKVFHRGIINILGGIDTNFGPTRGEWLRGIVVDRVDLMSYSASKEYEGMGRLGSKTEMVSTQEGQGAIKRGGIFEIRAGQTQSLDYAEWHDFAVSVAESLLSMQPDKEGSLTANERNRRMMGGQKV